MFINFDKVFREKRQTEIPIPEKFIEFLNKDLPDGIEYIQNEKGNLSIISTKKENKFVIGGLTFDLTSEQIEVLGSDYSVQDVLDYSYNAQKPINIKPLKEGFILLNGKELPIDKLIDYNPYVPVKYVEGSFVMSPPKFEDDFNLSIGNNIYSRNLIVSRIPSDDININCFESKSEEPLIIRYSYCKREEKLSMSISYNLKYAKSIRDIVESIMIYNSIIDGDGIICGNALKIKFDSKQFVKFDEKSALFWEKVLKVEDILGVSFIPPMEDVEFDKICDVEKLYQSLICKKAFRENKKITTIDSKMQMYDGHRMEEQIGKVLYLQFNAEFSTTLFGVDIKLPALISIFNAKLVNIENNVMFFEDESDEKTRYMSIMIFKNVDEVEEYSKMNNNNIINEFYNASNIIDYIK